MVAWLHDVRLDSSSGVLRSVYTVMHKHVVIPLGCMQELHQRYYEPLARIAPSLEEIVQGPPMKKLLFMTDPAVIENDLKPLWEVSHLFA